MNLCKLAAAIAMLMHPASAFSQNGAFRGMRYLGEIGHLETDADPRTSADLVVARAVSRNQDSTIEGTDDRGKRWTAAIQIDGGVGWTDAWIGDFDSNGREAAGEDRRIAGIYEAKDAHWRLIHPADPAPYMNLFRANYRQSRVVHLLPQKETEARDLGNGLSGTSPLKLLDVLSPAPECSGVVHLPPAVNGRLVHLDHDPCDELKHIRLLFSDNSTCYSDGGMTVVIERVEGREIIEAQQNGKLEALPRTVAIPGFKIGRAGQTMPGKCSPAMLWTIEQ